MRDLRNTTGNTFSEKLKMIVLGYPQMKKENQTNRSGKPRVIVVGRNSCSNLTMARSLGHAGYEVEVVKVFQVEPKKRNVMKWVKIDAYSKYIKSYHVCITKRKAKNLIEFLMRISDNDEKKLLIPADDLSASIIDEYYDTLSTCYKMPNINGTANEIARMMNKDVQMSLAEQSGLPVIKSCVIRTADGQFTIPDTVSYPCFVKPNVSKNASKSKMAKCDNKEQLDKVLKKLASEKDVEMIVQDYVEIDKEYSILGVSTADGVIGPGFFSAEQGGHLEHRGVALIGKVLPIDYTPEWKELIDQCLAFITTLKYNGLFDVDLIETKDGKKYFVELNLRFGASGYAFDQCGVNLPGMFADYMLCDKKIDLDTKVETTGKLFLSEKVLLDEYLNCRISWETFNEYLNSVDIRFIDDPDDPKPYNHFRKFYTAAKYLRNRKG